MNYRKLNLTFGWLVFLIATIVYFITIEDTVSLWDCGEYITTAYKLEVGHPPGAPLFMMIGRLFSFFADPENVAVSINRLSALSSSLSILFMFWSITLLAKKIALKDKKELSKGDKIAVLGSGLIGSLAYTFSDSFWFSAVEGEVYAMASLFTAIIFWAILKWDEEMALVQHENLDADYAPNRWLLLIMFLLGLAIGVHLLGILVVPAIGFVIYFRYKKVADIKGILLTGIVALLTFKMSVVTNDAGSIVGLTSVGNAIYLSGLKWLVMLAPLGIVFYMSFGINKMSASKAQTTFWVFAGLMGLSLSSILLVYTGMSVTRVFFICSATFGAMSIYGYTTKRDLTKLGSFLMMGLIGIIIASIVNIFMKSSMMYFVISILGVLIFVGLTAYDTQKIKNMYTSSDSGELMGKKAVMGALTLYLDFINLFIMLLRLFGQRR